MPLGYGTKGSRYRSSAHMGIGTLHTSPLRSLCPRKASQGKILGFHPDQLIGRPSVTVAGLLQEVRFLRSTYSYECPVCDINTNRGRPARN